MILRRCATTCLLAALALALPGSARPEPQAPRGPLAVPFELLPSNHMVVRAKINGKGPFRLIFDLGSPVTLLGNATAEASGVVEADAPRIFLFGSMKKTDRTVSVSFASGWIMS